MALALDVGSELASVTKARAAITSTTKEDTQATHGGGQAAQLNTDASPLSDPRLTTPKKSSKKLGAWRKLVEAVRPSRRKARRAREFGATMRQTMDNPVGDTQGARNWQSTTSLLQRAEEACATNSTNMCLQDALEYAQPQGADDEEDTALAPIPTFLVSEKKEKKVVMKTAENEIGMFGTGTGGYRW